MTDQDKITALRDALQRAVFESVADSMDDWFANAQRVLAMTAEASDSAPDVVLMPREADERMLHAAEDVPAPRPYGAVYRAMVAARPAHLAAVAAPDPAPWPDFNGRTIRHGDRLAHPDGNEFVAVRMKGFADESDAWRAVYDYDPQHVSRLCLQIGDKGRAVLSAAAPAAPIGEVSEVQGVIKGGMQISKTWMAEDGTIKTEHIDPASIYATEQPTRRTFDPSPLDLYAAKPLRAHIERSPVDRRDPPFNPIDERRNGFDRRQRSELAK